MRKDRAPGRGRVDDRRRRYLKIGNDGAAAPFLQLALPSFRRSLALGNVGKGRAAEQVGLFPDALHRGNVAGFSDAMAGHARFPLKGESGLAARLGEAPCLIFGATAVSVDRPIFGAAVLLARGRGGKA